MPNYFKFVNKETGEADKFTDIDDRIRNHMGVGEDPVNFYEDWYDIIGLHASTGNDWAEIRRRFEAENEDQLVEIIDFLSQRYDISAWAMR